MAITTYYFKWNNNEVYVINGVFDGVVNEDKVIVGTYENIETLMRVGNGAKIHYGHMPKATFTVAHEDWHHSALVDRRVIGSTATFEPTQYCGARSYYSGGMRGRNKAIAEGEVNCQKCLKIFGK